MRNMLGGLGSRRTCGDLAMHAPLAPRLCIRMGEKADQRHESVSHVQATYVRRLTVRVSYGRMASIPLGS